MHPFADEFEVFDGSLGADDTDGLAGAKGVTLFPGPGIGLAVDVDEVGFPEWFPPGSGAID